MKYFFIIALFWLGLGNSVHAQTDAYKEMLKEYYKNTVPFIQPKDLYQRMLKGEKMYLLDTRESSEYEVSAIKGALHVGYLFFTKAKVDEVKKSDLIIVYCTIGARSESIGEKLLKSGFTNVFNLYGGIINWKNLGFPVYHEDNKTEDVHVYSKKWGVWLTNGKAKY